MYATTTEFEQEVGALETVELTNLDDPSAATVNTTRLEKALLAASGEINSYLASRYQIPISPIPSVLRTYCIDIACYRLAKNNPPESFATKYNSAIARLKDIEKGQMQLVSDDGVAIAQRPMTNQIIDDRGNLLDDWSVSYIPGGEARITDERLRFY